VKGVGAVALGLAALVGLAATPVGCGPSATSDTYERTTHACLPGVCLEASAPPMDTDSGFGNQPLEKWPDSNAGPLSGVFATLAVVTASVALMPVQLKLLFRLRLLQTAGSNTVEQSNTLCAFKLPSDPGLATLVIPPALQTIIQENSVVVSKGDYLSSVGTSQSYTPPPFLLVLGAKLKNPETDPLPTMADLAGEWDEDHDGHPGVTIDATVFTCTATQELYVALRTGGAMNGTVTGFDTIDGTMDIFESESVLGYSASCLAGAADINPKLTPSSPFHAQRLANESELHTKGNVTCADIIAQAPTLFPDWTN
jgi:hypothetical protein